MSLLTYERYVSLTGDSTTAASAVDANITEAEGLAAEFLRRVDRMELGEYVDLLHVDVDGRVYPKAVPVSSLPASSTDNGVQILDSGMSLGFLYGWDMIIEQSAWEDWNAPWTGYLVQRPLVSVQYTGGWTAATVPFSVARTIARLAYRLAYPAALDDPLGGATSVHVGDVSASYSSAQGDAAGKSQIEVLAPGSESALWQYRWREDYA